MLQSCKTLHQRSRGQALCIWFPPINYKKIKPEKEAKWLRIVHKQCDELKKCLNHLESNIKRQMCTNGSTELVTKALSWRVALLFSVDTKYFPFENNLEELPLVDDSCYEKTLDIKST